MPHMEISGLRMLLDAVSEAPGVVQHHVALLDVEEEALEVASHQQP